MDFAAKVERQAERYFGDVLPRFVERYFGGDGRELLWRLMDAHDRRDLGSVSGVTATRGAIERAVFVRESCPLGIEPLLMGTAAGTVLGLFQHRTTEMATPMGGSATLAHERVVTLYEGSFIAAGWAGAQLDDELFWTIFHEYLHYFESFLLTREQPLASRERGHLEPTRSLDEVRRHDRRAKVRKAVLWTLGLSVVALCVGVTAAATPQEPTEAPPPPPETAAQRGEREASLQRERVHAAARAQELSVRVSLAEAARLVPGDAIALVGSPVCDSEIENAACVRVDQLPVDPNVPQARAVPAGAVRTIMWVRPNPDVFPVRLIGLAWDADGGVQQVALSSR